jgi:DNA-binding NtrC family response regulator
VSRGLLAAAARRRGAIAFTAPTEERTRDEVRSQLRSASRAVLVAPMMVGQTPAGFVYLDRASTQSWSPSELAFAEAAAAVAALHRLGGAIQAPRPAANPAESAPASPDDPVGASPAFAQVLKLAGAAARVTSTVLVSGESGTGKEEIARYIHRRGGRGPFVAVDCGAIPEALAESELFGHERGAFTGAVAAREGRVEAADGGTLFLDEIGELSLVLQVKLLRVLQERVFHRVGSTAPRSVDLRVVAATHRRLEAEVAAGRFREDLFYRLNVIHIQVPALRERREDIPVLVDLFVGQFAALNRIPAPLVSVEAMNALVAYSWPGNVRELENTIERLVVTQHGTTIQFEALPPDVRGYGEMTDVKPRQERRRTVGSDLYKRMTEHGESFWTTVYPLFMAREITTADVRQVVAMGLRESRGSYKIVARIFNMEPRDYKRFLNFLRKHDCQIPFKDYR